MRGRDWQSEQLRYIVHFSDGGAGTRYADARLEVGAEISDNGRRYVLECVKQATTPYVLAHAWVRLIDPGLTASALRAASARQCSPRDKIAQLLHGQLTEGGSWPTPYSPHSGMCSPRLSRGSSSRPSFAICSTTSRPPLLLRRRSRRR
jgi:hypothetical protein